MSESTTNLEKLLPIITKGVIELIQTAKEASVAINDGKDLTNDSKPETEVTAWTTWAEVPIGVPVSSAHPLLADVYIKLAHDGYACRCDGRFQFSNVGAPAADGPYVTERLV